MKLNKERINEVVFSDNFYRHLGQLSEDKFPPDIERLKHKCFCCGDVHLMVCGTLSVHKVVQLNRKKQIYLIVRHAPLGCFLAHNKENVRKFYQTDAYKSWLKPEKERRGLR